MANSVSPRSEQSGFFAKLTQNIQTFSHLLFPTSPTSDRASTSTSKASQSFRSNISANDLALNIERVQVDEISGSARVVLNTENSEDEEAYETASDNLVIVDSHKNYRNENSVKISQSPSSFQSPVRQLTSEFSKLKISSPRNSPNEPSAVGNRNYVQQPPLQNAQNQKQKFRYYKDILLEPQTEEILGSQPEDIYRNIVNGPYKNIPHYLNIHFKLLREDFISPLREGIQQLRREFPEYGELHPNENITLYPNCRFISMSAKKKVVGYELCFDVEHKLKINQWKNTRSLFNGTLLAFSSDNFKSFFFGFVVFTEFHEMLYRRVITVELCGGRHLNFKDFAESYAMIESSSFFAPYFYVMKTMQSYSNENFPFEKYLIRTDKHITPPKYFAKCPSIQQAYDLSKQAQEDLGLNPTQFQAYKTALTRELAIIQGPPGTGKTYVGLRIVESLLKNKHLKKYMNGPILIVCYTNHALDQFVAGVLKYTQNVIRLGYSRNNDKVKVYNHLEIIETFYAISNVAKASKKGKNQKKFVVKEDFDRLFCPDKWGKYTLNVRSFKTDTTEKRVFDAELMKAYFFMYVDSPFNELSTVPKKKVLKQCHQCEDHIERISYKISLLNSLNGIVDAKHLEDFMDDVSLFVLKTPGSLASWLTNGDFQLNEDQVRREQNIIRNRCSSTSEDYSSEDYSDYDSDESMDRKEEAFFTLDLAIIQNEIEDAQSLLEDVRRSNDNLKNRYKVDSSEVENEIINKIERLQLLCQLVKGTLFTLSNSNVSMKDIETGLINHIQSSQDLISMSLGNRWKLYWYWMESFRRNLYTEMKTQSIKYKRVIRQLEETIRYPELLDIMKTKDVVAMTTTKAAKIHDMLNDLKPKIVVIEEAAEVLETHILASLSKHCEHVVLIGDHKQLRPKTSVHELSRDFNFDVSMFERMINNDMHHVTLEVQHRMRPEICELLTPTIYKSLINHASVGKLPNIKGMPRNVQFFDHKVYEGKHLHETSTWNAFEVNVLLNLSDYLLEQGYKGRDITIIAAYKGQVELFEDTVSTRFQHLTSVRITTIDAYQGEENKIILLSLVRSNVHNNIGFLKIPNRVCVALSRAKQGLFIMGNMKCLSHDSDLWQNIKKILVKQRAINENFRLQCEKHRCVTTIRALEDFEDCCCLRT